MIKVVLKKKKAGIFPLAMSRGTFPPPHDSQVATSKPAPAAAAALPALSCGFTVMLREVCHKHVLKRR